MSWLNFHHLLYFRLVAREGSVAAAARALHLGRSTVSAQVRQLEQALGRPLFVSREGRLALTPLGVEVARIADEVDTLGRGVLRLARGEVPLRPLSLGVVQGLPATTVASVLAPALAQHRVRCVSAELQSLFRALREDELDAVLAIEPAPPELGLRSRSILSSEVALFAAPALARSLAKGLPGSLQDAPFLLPAPGDSLGDATRAWLARRHLEVREVAVTTDLELMRRLGSAGCGVFPVRTSFSIDVAALYGVRKVLALEGLLERCYLLTPRGADSPFVQALLASAAALSAVPAPATTKGKR